MTDGDNVGWINDDGEHEGWDAPLFADGNVAGGWGTSPDGSTRVIVSILNRNETALTGNWDYRAESEVIGWVAACVCGWRGAPFSRVDVEAEEDLAARRVFSPDSHAPQIEELIHQEWIAHLSPLEAVDLVRRRAQELAASRRALDEAVDAARSAKVPWETIGGATGMSRQSAHERWSTSANSRNNP